MKQDHKTKKELEDRLQKSRSKVEFYELMAKMENNVKIQKIKKELHGLNRADKKE